MIRLLAQLEAATSVPDAVSAARHDISRGRGEAALRTLLGALLATHAREPDFAAATTLLAELLAQMKQPRAALSAAWYHGEHATQSALLEHVPPIDRARTWAAWAETDASRRSKLYRAAAAELERAGILVRAAIYYEKCGDNPQARALWARLGELLDAQRADRYAAGLAHFNQARMCRATGDAQRAHHATVAAVHRLEEAADRFESMGQRERAFDCYHVLIEIGSATETFENVLEGSVNAIRILSEDNLRYHALRLYEHVIRMAGYAGERAAAATLAREMTDYARRQGLHRIASRGTLMQADLWTEVADAIQKRDGPAHLAENALLASLLASAELGQYTRVGELYGVLAKLDLEASRREHYARVAQRYADAANATLESGLREERLGEHVGPPEVWHVDLLEWEAQGSAAEACADVLLDPSEDMDRITRRAALLGRIAALAAEQAEPGEQARAAATVANHLAPIGLYGLLSSLEKLYGHDSAAVRLAAVRALSRYYYKRTFLTLERAIADADSEVAKEGMLAIERLRFDHAFDPLARIYRSAAAPEARLAALKAIARIDAMEAAELVVGVLEHGNAEEREVALNALRTARGNRLLEAARSAYADASPKLREQLGAVLRARGTAV